RSARRGVADGLEPDPDRRSGESPGALHAGDRRAHGRRAARGRHRAGGDRSPAPGRRDRPGTMTEAALLDRAFARIMRGLVDTGTAPHYAELARAFGISVEEG